MDWAAFIKLSSNAEAVMLLVALGILSYGRKGNWEIIVDKYSLNPRSDAGGYALYFNRKEDAIDYIRREKNRFWLLVQYAEAMSREEALGLS